MLSEPKTPIIFFKDVTYTYPFQEKPVLNKVNFSINEGEMVLIIGPTGCGKTTLALCFNGLIPHVLKGKLEGEIIVNGNNVAITPIREMAKHVAIVFQNPDEQLTCLYVEDEVAFGPENMKVPPEEVLKRVDEALTFVGLSGFREKNVYDLSGGQKQRLGIASILALRPKILVLDAPLSNLDPIGASEILHVIDNIRKEHRLTTVIIEHKIDELISMVDKVIVMNKMGSIEMIGSPRKIMKNALYLRDELGLWIPQFVELSL